jgi:uncharacterized protein (TIGR00730 family)
MTRPSRQLASPSYRLAVEDTEFQLRDEMRALRFAMEYGKAELLLRDHGIRSTVVVFGSARVPSPEEARRFAKAARGKAAVAEAEKRTKLVHWYEEARRFGRIVSERGGALLGNASLRDNVIATGGGPGIMEAANRGAAEAGAPTIGFNITLPHEQQPNAFTTPALTFRFHYFAMRKMHLAMRANALAVFPGGFGTMDELFEILTLQQTHKAPPMPVILFNKAFWTRAINFEALVEFGTISAADLGLFDLVDDAEEAWTKMCDRGLVAHTQPAPESDDFLG